MTTLSAVIEDLVLMLLGSPPDQAGIAAGQAGIRAYRNDPSMGVAWTGLKKEVFCSRIELLLADPTKLNQRPTGYCAPSACLFVLFKRAPAATASFCIQLARDGRATIGDLTTEISQELLSLDIPAYAAANKQPIDPVDYILMLAIQNQMFPGIKNPEDSQAVPTMRASKITQVLEKTTLFDITSKDNPSVDDFQNLDPKTEAILVAGIDFFSTKISIPFFAPGGRHAAVLIPPVTTAGGAVTFHFWSWGFYQGSETLPVDDTGYVQSVSTNKFNLSIDTVIFAKVKF